jgi:predicted Rossmann fold flavoprotein
MDSYDAIVVGAGAAGMMCAAVAGQRGRRVLLLEHNREPGAKILISGGGRCNFTNRDCSPERFISANPHFCKSALSRYAERDFVALVERYRIAYHEKKLGQLFCDGSAREILAMLRAECAKGGVDLRTGHRVTAIERADRFRLEADRGTFAARALVVASGGLSIPKLGASAFAYDLARRFEIPIVEPRPGLVPMRLTGAMLELCRSLTGVSVDAVASCGRASFRENLLFTHRGLSGPAILQISSYWHESEPILIDLMPDDDAERMLKDRKRARRRTELKNILGEILPTRLAHAIAADFPGGPIANLPDRALIAVAERIKRWRVVPAETEGYEKAEVTVGGIGTDALSSRTMETRTVPGLFFIGEAVDVTGWLGGYNFQWAWSSGWCAAQAL